MTDNIYIQTENNDKLKEECGVFGVYDFDGHDVASTIYYGLLALQHRGQESCGIAVSDTNGPKGKVLSSKDMGLVNEAFTPEQLIDGDDTYPLDCAQEMVDRVLQHQADMVVGDRLSSTYFTENKRPFHNFGNSLMRAGINSLFHANIKDIMTGYRAFSYEFVKTFPVFSKGFEIETEMTIHAVNYNMQVENVVVEYRDRPQGSESKLNTYSDGFRVIRKMMQLYKNYKPLHFFGMLALLLIAVSVILFVPVFLEYLNTGLVPRFPTLIACGFILLAGIQSFFAGMMLEVMAAKDRKDFEYRLNRVHGEHQVRKGL